MGAAVNVQDADGCSPLWNAIAWRRGEVAKDVAKLLIQAKADVNLACHTGSSPLNVAIQYENHGCTKLLLEAKVDVNAVGEFGITHFQYAVGFGSAISVTQLLKFNANVDDTIYQYASLNYLERENVLNALAEHQERSSQLNTVCLGDII